MKSLLEYILENKLSNLIIFGKKTVANSNKKLLNKSGGKFLQNLSGSFFYLNGAVPKKSA